MTNYQENCGIAMPPQLPNELPALIGLLTKNVPSYYKPAVASAVLPALAAHLHGVKFRYWDNVLHEATFMNLLPDSFTREQYRNMRFSCGKQGDGESTLRVWMNRKYIVFDEASRNFCKTEDYMKKTGLAS